MSILLAILLFSRLASSIVFVKSYSECFSSSLDSSLDGPACFNVSSAFCYMERLSFGSAALNFESTWAWSDLFYELQAGNSKLTLPLYGKLTGCQVTMNINSYNFTEAARWLNLCATASLTCPASSAVGSFQKQFDIPCWRIKHCEFVDCPDHCNGHSSCQGKLGLCSCPAPYYGYDCSLEVKDKCIIAGVGSECWTTPQVTLQTADSQHCTATVSVQNTVKAVINIPGDLRTLPGTGTGTSIPGVALTACAIATAPLEEQSIFRVYYDDHGWCYYCAALGNLDYKADGSLTGCTTIEVWCNDSYVSSTVLGCSTLAASTVQCIAPPPPPPVTPEPTPEPTTPPQLPPQPPAPMWYGTENDMMMNLFMIIGVACFFVILVVGLSAVYIYYKKGRWAGTVPPKEQQPVKKEEDEKSESVSLEGSSEFQDDSS